MMQAIQDHPAPPRRRLIAPRRLIAAALLLVATAAGWYAWSHRPGPLPWAKERRWSSRPIAPTTLETNGLQRIYPGGAWRNLPFRIGLAEETAARRCAALARSRRFLHNDVSEFEGDAAREELEGILREHPDFFYAEALLALWHRIHGDASLADEFQERAYRHAPVVLVQRFRDADGRPLRGAFIQEAEVECNRVANGSLDPSLKLLFMDLITDDDGAIYLPAYDTVYRLYSISHPEGYDLESPRLGWFQSPRKVGILPPMTARPRPAAGSP
jgi:hypothetical protein